MKKRFLKDLLVLIGIMFVIFIVCIFISIPFALLKAQNVMKMFP